MSHIHPQAYSFIRIAIINCIQVIITRSTAFFNGVCSFSLQHYLQRRLTFLTLIQCGEKKTTVYQVEYEGGRPPHNEDLFGCFQASENNNPSMMVE